MIKPHATTTTSQCYKAVGVHYIIAIFHAFTALREYTAAISKDH